jgi:predicted DNA repair protein MutK
VLLTSLRTSLVYGTNAGMTEMRKVTVEVPKGTLEMAQAFTGEGVTETIRVALKRLASIQAQQELLKLRGKVKFSVDLMALRKSED